MQKIKIGISACLLGEEVRYNGGHSLSRYIRDTLGQFFDYVPVCPEVECGLPIPREAMRLVGDPDKPRLITSRSGVDMTDKMTDWTTARLEALKNENLSGFIFKSKSPSSGAFRVKVYDSKGMPSRTGAGLFAGAFMRANPLIPVEEDGRLNDMKLRENFVERVFVFERFRQEVSSAKHFKMGDLVSFHTRHKLQILAHDQKLYREMGVLVAQGKNTVKQSGSPALLREYELMLNKAMQRLTTPAKNTNVLQHITGYFKKQLSSDEKQELVERIEQYRLGHLPLIVPVTLLQHFIRKFNDGYLSSQTYLQPHPMELQLRNHS